jgi:hypothetical protein
MKHCVMIFLGLFLELTAIGPALAAEDKYAVIYPNMDGLGGQAFGFRALKLALEKSGTPYHAELQSMAMNHARARDMLDSGAITICDFGTSAAFEEKYRAVYIPIDRGLNGLRLLLVMPLTEQRLGTMKAGDLFSLKLGQGRDWADVEILEHGGFTVSFPWRRTSPIYFPCCRPTASTPCRSGSTRFTN